MAVLSLGEEVNLDKNFKMVMLFSESVEFGRNFKMPMISLLKISNMDKITMLSSFKKYRIRTKFLNDYDILYLKIPNLD